MINRLCAIHNSFASYSGDIICAYICCVIICAYLLGVIFVIGNIDDWLHYNSFSKQNSLL